MRQLFLVGKNKQNRSIYDTIDLGDKFSYFTGRDIFSLVIS